MVIRQKLRTTQVGRAIVHVISRFKAGVPYEPPPASTVNFGSTAATRDPVTLSHAQLPSESAALAAPAKTSTVIRGHERLSTSSQKIKRESVKQEETSSYTIRPTPGASPSDMDA
jgi:hypothetical protein